MNKTCGIYIVEYYATIKNNEMNIYEKMSTIS